MIRCFTLVIAAIASFNLHAQQLYFPPLTGNTWDTISPYSLGYCQPNIDSLYRFLEANNSKAFILLKDGKIVLEKYFGSHTSSTLWQWASAGKTVSSFITGIAQQEGHLAITDTTKNYLGQGWTNCAPEQENKISIWNQLTMTTGLDDGVPDNACTLDTCLNYLADAGTRWSYHNAPYTLLESVIENATGQSLNTYTTQKLKNPTGMTGSFLSIGYNTVFFSNARSMARFGSLILNKGNWNGNQIMTDSVYFNSMVNTSQNLNKAYGYLWWLNGKQTFMVPTLQSVFAGSIVPNAPADMISAMGKGGQFLNIVPSQNLVWLRMGDEPNNSQVPFLLNNDIWAYVNELECGTAGTGEGLNQINPIRLYPNPITDILHIKADIPISKIEICHINGRLIRSENAASKETSISINDLQSGLYFARVWLIDGKGWTEKWIRK
jgi:CubicO group peptidase (beta-lactamase class C family)